MIIKKNHELVADLRVCYAKDIDSSEAVQLGRTH